MFSDFRSNVLMEFVLGISCAEKSSLIRKTKHDFELPGIIPGLLFICRIDFHHGEFISNDFELIDFIVVDKLPEAE